MKKLFSYLVGFGLLCAILSVGTILWSQSGQKAPPPGEKASTATLAGGCFWCIEAAFKDLPGVVSVTSGYTGGDEPNPKYEAVSAGNTGHVEAVQIQFDPKKITFDRLLEIYWQQINPTDAGGQFVDRGPQYQAIIFYHTNSQKLAAVQSKQNLAKSGRFEHPILTPIKPFKNFYPAEDYHQGYFRKNPTRYKMYHQNSGRDSFFQKIWGDIKKLGS